MNTPSAAAQAEIQALYDRGLFVQAFHAARREDPFVPIAPTAIARSFEIGRELPEARVKALLRRRGATARVPRIGRVGIRKKSMRCCCCFRRTRDANHERSPDSQAAVPDGRAH